MPITINRDKKKIFAEIMKSNPELTYKDITYICATPERTVFKWISGESAPSDYALHLILKSLHIACMNIPRELYRFTSAKESPARIWAKKNKKAREKPIYIGVKLHKSRKNETVVKIQAIPNTKDLTIAEIAKMAKIKYSTVHYFIKKHNIPYKKKGRS